MVAPGGEFRHAVCYTQFPCCCGRALASPEFKIATCFYDACHEAGRPFQVTPKRWIVERTIAWISSSRRLARDFERYARAVAAFVRIGRFRIHALEEMVRISVAELI